MRGVEVSLKKIFFFDFTQMLIGKSCQLCQRQKICCALGGLGPSLKRPRMEEAQTPRPLKKPRSELVAAIWGPKKPKVYLKVK